MNAKYHTQIDIPTKQLKISNTKLVIHTHTRYICQKYRHIDQQQP